MPFSRWWPGWDRRPRWVSVPTIMVIRRYPGPNSTGQAPLRARPAGGSRQPRRFVVIAGIEQKRSRPGGFSAACGRKQAAVAAFGHLSHTTRAHVVRQAAGIALAGGLAAVPAFFENLILALTNGTVWVIPGGGDRQVADGGREPLFDAVA